MKSKNITLGVLLLTLFTAEFMISPSKADSGQFIYPPPTPIIIPMGQYYNISWEPLSPIGPSPPLLEGLYDVQYYNEGFEISGNISGGALDIEILNGSNYISMRYNNSYTVFQQSTNVNQCFRYFVYFSK